MTYNNIQQHTITCFLLYIYIYIIIDPMKIPWHHQSHPLKMGIPGRLVHFRWVSRTMVLLVITCYRYIIIVVLYHYIYIYMIQCVYIYITYTLYIYIIYIIIYIYTIYNLYVYVHTLLHITPVLIKPCTQASGEGSHNNLSPPYIGVPF